MFKRCKKKDIYLKYGFRNYEKDILSSLYDVLPKYGQKEEEASVSFGIEKKSTQINSFNKPPQVQSSRLEISEEPDPAAPSKYCKSSLEYFSLNSKLRQACISWHESKTTKFLMYFNVSPLLPTFYRSSYSPCSSPSRKPTTSPTDSSATPLSLTVSSATT